MYHAIEATTVFCNGRSFNRRKHKQELNNKELTGHHVHSAVRSHTRTIAGMFDNEHEACAIVHVQTPCGMA
jgi:hypothetical protein